MEENTKECWAVRWDSIRNEAMKMGVDIRAERFIIIPKTMEPTLKESFWTFWKILIKKVS